MNSIALANLRSGGRRLFSAGLAVAVSVAFVVAALVLLDSFTQTMRTQLEAEAAGADLVLTENATAEPEQTGAEDQESMPDAALAQRVAALGAVSSAQPIRLSFASADLGGNETMMQLGELPEHAQTEFVSGHPPEDETEIALLEETAELYGLQTGDRITVLAEEDVPGGAAGQSAGSETATESGGQDVVYTVSGTTEGTNAAPRGYLTAGGMDVLPVEAQPESIRVVLAGAAHGDESAQAAVQREIAGMIAQQSGLDAVERGEQGIAVGALQIQTNTQLVEARLAQTTGDSGILLGIAFGFGAIAVFVAALVIANTFQVLVASRTRTLALMRAIGADAGQIRGATLAEGAVLGVLGSAAGVLLGYAIAWGLAAAARAGWMPDFADIRLLLPALLAGPAVGVSVTLLACLSPARRATRVSPMAALRPADLASRDGGVPWVRTIAGTLLALGGAVATVFGANSHALPPALAGAIAGFLGVLLLTRVIVPPAVQVLGRALSALTGGRQLPRMVGRNAVQTPGRTASTTAALLIGVTLVTTMTVGAATAQRSMNEDLAERLPLDIAVGASGPEIDALLDDSGIVAEHATVPGTEMRAEIGGQEQDVQLVAAGTEAAERIPRRADALPQPGNALVAAGALDGAEGAQATRIVLDGAEGEHALAAEEAAWVPAGSVVLAADDARAYQLSEQEGQTWVRMTEGASPGAVGQLVSELSAHSDAVSAEAAQQRAGYAQIIDVMLLIVLVLLAAAIVVAVIGIGNTLSLSVFERRREAALLRAMGMSRGGVGAMITLEAVLMCLVALVAGIGLGVLFGWAGVSSVVAGDVLPVLLDVPWERIGLIAAAALLAAVLASALPARALSRTAPAAGLSTG